MLQLGPHMAAQLGIEIGQRFVHQEHRRAADDRPCERDALALAARQLARIAIEQRLELDLLRRIEDGRVHLGLRQFLHLQRKPDILGHGLVRIERIGLEHHRDVAIFRQHFGDIALTDMHASRARSLQPRQDAKRRCLSRTGRSQQHKELPRLDLEIELLQHFHAAEALLHGVKLDRSLGIAVCHLLPLHGAKKDAL